MTTQEAGRPAAAAHPTERREAANEPLGVPGAVQLLTAYVVLLWGLPTQLTIPVLGSIGQPSTIGGLACLAWWAWHQLIRVQEIPRRRQPVRVAGALSLALVLASYALAHARGLPQDEVSPSDSALLRVLSWAGVLLLSLDGLTSTEHVRRLARRIVVVGAFVSLLGIAQFVTGETLVDRISLPGFSNEAVLEGVQERGGFTRASATAAHPLEYAVILSATLPLAIVTAMGAPGGGMRRWWATASVAAASILSVSRSAIVGMVVSVVVLMPALNARARRVLLAAGAVGVAAAYIAVPGLIGTVRGLFLGVGQDSSTESRTAASDVALEIAANYQPLGRGLGTFLPTYQILDNQLLLLYIEIGALGLAAFLGLVVTAMVQAQRARSRTDSPEFALICQAFTAGLAATIALFAFFDALSFPKAAGTLFVLIGLCGAAGSAARATGRARTEATP